MTDRELMQQVYQYLTGESVRNKTTDNHIAELISKGLAQPEQEPLTDEEILKMWDDTRNDPIAPSVFCLIACVRHVERAHGIGGGE